jgi:L-iditol 2-dehydrogenase
MKALTLVEYNHFVYGDAPDPKPGAAEVLICVKACGICGSDVHGMDGSTGRRRPPIIMGHEASGVITALGAGVANWRVGDRVTFDSTVYCGNCDYCRRGQVNLCDNRRVLGVSCEEYRCHGAFAEFVVVPQHILYRLPDAVTFEQAAMIEALSVAVHAVHRAATGHRAPPGSADTSLGPIPPAPAGAKGSAVVVGAGMIGLLVVQALRAAGWTQVIAVDLEEQKLNLAKQFGAHAAIKADAGNVASEVIRLTGGKGADAALEVVGATPTVQTAVACVRKGGTVVLVGNLAKEVTFPLQAAVTRELNVFGSCASAGEYTECLQLLARGAVNVNALISAVAPLSEGAQWFARLQKKESGLMKVVLTPGDRG